jgi:pimeloyl-ACP methyl ester carboxylesterase
MSGTEESSRLRVEHSFAAVGDGQTHFVTAGDGEALVLLHGWPQTWFAWRKLIPVLAGKYRVIAPDLRGLGDSSRPATGFDKKTVAADVASLLRDVLNISNAYVVGHDWGGPVAFALAAFHPGLVKKLVMLDAAVPGDGSGTFSQSGRRWHHAFHQTLDLPEDLIAGREDVYYRWFYEHYGFDRSAIAEDEVQEYLRTYRSRSTLRTGLAYYRAIEQDVRDNASYLADHKLAMPILAYGGAKGFGRGDETLSSLRRVGTDVQGGVVEACGHWIPEEQPAFLLERLIPFLAA